jgi:hypothetical protein
MLAEAVEGVTGHEPFAPILTTFQFTLLDEHEDAQMGSAEQFRGFHDRYGFSSVGSLFHGDASTGMNCPAVIGHLAWKYHIACQAEGKPVRCPENGVSWQGQRMKGRARETPVAENRCRLHNEQALSVSRIWSLVAGYMSPVMAD